MSVGSAILTGNWKASMGMTIPLGRMEQDVGSGSQSKHQREVGGCSKEGTHSMVGLNGTMEYYCTEHYNEMAEIVQMLTGGS